VASRGKGVHFAAITSVQNVVKIQFKKNRKRKGALRGGKIEFDSLKRKKGRRLTASYLGGFADRRGTGGQKAKDFPGERG